MTVLTLKNAVHRVIESGHYTGVVIIGGRGVVLRNVTITPPPATNINAQAVRIVNCPGVLVEGCTITGQAATTGVAIDAPGPAGCVVGLWAGEGIHVSGSDNAIIRRNRITRFHQAITFGGANVTIEGNTITNIRTTMIAGIPGNGCRIVGNSMLGSHPWRWGETPGGDHANALHVWLNGTTCDGLTVCDNVFDQADGVAIMGLVFQNVNKGIGVGKFTHADISRNTVIIGQGQAIVLRGVSGVAADNQIVPLGTGKAAAELRVYETQGAALAISGTKGGKVALDRKMTAAQRALVTVTP